MSRRVGSRGDRGKAHVYATSHGNNFFDDETASLVSRWLKFYKVTLTIGVMTLDPQAVYPWRLVLRGVETTSISSESCTISNGAFPRCRPDTRRGASRGVTRAKDLFIDIEADFFRDKVHPNLGA